MYKKLNICFLLLPNFKSRVIENKQLTDVIEFDWVSPTNYVVFVRKRRISNGFVRPPMRAAISQNTRQIVAYVIGDRIELTFKRLIRKIPLEYLKCQSCSDYWKSYAILRAKGNHRSGDPQIKWVKTVNRLIAEANRHIERYLATLRVRITRYVRKSLSFSRNLKYYPLVIKIFMVDHNQNCLSTLFI